jgi:hypothetical protein
MRIDCDCRLTRTWISFQIKDETVPVESYTYFVGSTPAFESTMSFDNGFQKLVTVLIVSFKDNAQVRNEHKRCRRLFHLGFW